MRGIRPRPARPDRPPPSDGSGGLQHSTPIHQRSDPASAGFTLIELLFTLAVLATVIGMALPIGGEVLDELRTAAAARYLASRIMHTRIEAIKRATPVGVRFQPAGADYTFRCYADGNGNGVRAADIQSGIDPALGEVQQLADNFSGVRFELMPGLPDADGVVDGRTDGVRIGSARILTMGPDGTATSGTLYVRGRRSQYAVRVLGATGRTRVLQYRSGERAWVSR